MQNIPPHFPGIAGLSDQPPPYESHPPPSGYRIPLHTNTPFSRSTRDVAGKPPCTDADGISPVYFGSAILDDSVHPCKIAPQLPNPCRLSYGGAEIEHQGRYDLLPFTDDMELIPARNGHVPKGRVPILGGSENGRSLYHALARIQGVWVPGKCAEHLNGTSVPYGGGEVYASEYQLLVWKHREQY